jgi:hypothetical protein
MTLSTSSWKPPETVLLISRPGWRTQRQTWLSVTTYTTVEVDPDLIPDAAWLKNFVQRMTRRDHLNPPFPNNCKLPLPFLYLIYHSNILTVFNFQSFLQSTNKMLYSLAEVDELCVCSLIDISSLTSVVERE